MASRRSSFFLFLSSFLSQILLDQAQVAAWPLKIRVRRLLLARPPFLFFFFPLPPPLRCQIKRIQRRKSAPPPSPPSFCTIGCARKKDLEMTPRTFFFAGKEVLPFFFPSSSIPRYRGRIKVVISSRNTGRLAGTERFFFFPSSRAT